MIERPDLQQRIDKVVAETLGTGLRSGFAERFDWELAGESLRFFDARVVPAVQTPLPPGVTGVHFKSDLSTCAILATLELRARGGMFAAL